MDGDLYTQTVASLLKRARATAGITQKELAGRSGVSRATIARYEAGTVDPPASVFVRILDAAGYGVQSYFKKRSAPADVSAPSESWVAEHQVSAYAHHVATALRAGSEPDARIALLNLLDVLSSATEHPQLLQRLVQQPPKWTGDRRYDAWLAAAVEHFCAHSHVTPPPWTQDERRIAVPAWRPTEFGPLDNPIAHCPAAFLRRGILISPEELSRA